MNSTRPLVIAVGLMVGGQLAFAQDVSRYRAYVLESSLDSVVVAYRDSPAERLGGTP